MLTSKRGLTRRGLRVHRIKHMRRLLHKTVLDRHHLRAPLIDSPHLVITERIPEDAVLLSPLLPAASSLLSFPLSFPSQTPCSLVVAILRLSCLVLPGLVLPLTLQMPPSTREHFTQALYPKRLP